MTVELLVEIIMTFKRTANDYKVRFIGTDDEVFVFLYADKIITLPLGMLRKCLII